MSSVDVTMNTGRSSNEASGNMVSNGNDGNDVNDGNVAVRRMEAPESTADGYNSQFMG